MKDNKTEKTLDQFTEKMVKTAGTQSPSADFAMAVLLQLEHQKTTSLKPVPALISWRAWISIAAIVIAILSLSFFVEPTSMSLFADLSFELPTLSLSNLTISPLVSIIAACFIVLFGAYFLLMQRVIIRRFDLI